MSADHHNQRPLVVATTGCAALLCALCIAWEVWLAPLYDGAWLLALKAVPIAFALPGFARGHLRTYQWWSMLILAYVAEGLVRGASDPGTSAMVGWIEAGLAGTVFVLILLYCRRRLAARKAESQAPAAPN